MRRTLLISGIAVGAMVVIAAALVVYAFFNLSSLVSKNQQRILTRVSDALGRRVEVGQIKAQMGFGVSVEVSGLKIADDAGFSTRPFLAANEVSVEVEFVPLLYGEARVARLDLINPDIRIVRNARGDLNIDSIGTNAEQVSSPKKRRTRKKSSLAELSVKALSVENGAVYYNDLAEKATPIEIHRLDFDVTNFSAVAAFDFDMKLAFAGDEQNVAASGKLGPLLQHGVLDASGIPIDMKLRADAIPLDRIRTLTDVGADIPAALKIPDPISLAGTVQGSLAKIAFAINTDLTADRIAYSGFFKKPAGTAMTLKANGTWSDQLEIAGANLKLGDLELTASRFSVGGPRPLSAQIDTNNFNLANLSPMIPPSTGYGLAGMSEIHGSATLDNSGPIFDATVTLKQAGMKWGLVWPSAITDLNGTIRLTQGREIIELTSLSIGSAQANFEGRIDSVSPLNASYVLKADSLKLGELFPSRPGSGTINQLVVNGTADGELASPRFSARILSSDGSLEHASYRNLDLTAAYKDSRLYARPFNIDAFGGSLEADADATLGASPSFNATLVHGFHKIIRGPRPGFRAVLQFIRFGWRGFLDLWQRQAALNHVLDDVPDRDHHIPVFHHVLPVVNPAVAGHDQGPAFREHKRHRPKRQIDDLVQGGDFPLNAASPGGVDQREPIRIDNIAGHHHIGASEQDDAIAVAVRGRLAIDLDALVVHVIVLATIRECLLRPCLRWIRRLLAAKGAHPDQDLLGGDDGCRVAVRRVSLKLA